MSFWFLHDYGSKLRASRKRVRAGAKAGEFRERIGYTVRKRGAESLECAEMRELFNQKDG
jgi:hypothetical protein